MGLALFQGDDDARDKLHTMTRAPSRRDSSLAGDGFADTGLAGCPRLPRRQSAEFLAGITVTFEPAGALRRILVGILRQCVCLGAMAVAQRCDVATEVGVHC